MYELVEEFGLVAINLLNFQFNYDTHILFKPFICI